MAKGRGWREKRKGGDYVKRLTRGEGVKEAGEK